MSQDFDLCIMKHTSSFGFCSRCDNIKKKFCRSADTKRAPRCASDMVELTMSFVSSKFTVGDPVSSPKIICRRRQ